MPPMPPTPQSLSRQRQRSLDGRHPYQRHVTPARLDVSDRFDRIVHDFARLDDQLNAAKDTCRSIREQHRALETAIAEEMLRHDYPRTLIEGGRSSIAAQSVLVRSTITPSMVAAAAADLGISSTRIDALLDAVRSRQTERTDVKVRRIVYDDGVA